ncbi:MAG: P-loop NTPase [Planctomycetota bacterium]
MNEQALRLRQRLGQRPNSGGQQPARTIAIASGRPGVGTSTLATNLAVALQGRGLRVALVQADPEAGRRFTLEHVRDGARTLSEVVLDGPSGVRTVPAGGGLSGLGNLTPWQQARLWTGLASLDAQADVVLVQTAAGLGPETLDVLAAAPEVLVVTVPEARAVADAYALVKLLAARRPDAIVHLVVNRAGSAQAARSVAARLSRVAQRFIGRPVHPVGFVFEDPVVQRAAREGETFVTAHAESRAARCVTSMAQRLSRPAPDSAARSLAQCVRLAAQAPADSLANAGAS